MWHNVSPCLNPPAARPHATDPAPCLNRCSINNACFSATHLPGAQSGNRRMDEGDAANEWACSGEGREGRRMGESPEAWVTTGGWIRQKKLKDQWTWGWSVLLVPSALAQKDISVLLQPTREICRNRDEKGSSQGLRVRGKQRACVFVEEYVGFGLSYSAGLDYVHSSWNNRRGDLTRGSTPRFVTTASPPLWALSQGHVSFYRAASRWSASCSFSELIFLWPGKCNAACGGQQSCADAHFRLKKKKKCKTAFLFIAFRKAAFEFIFEKDGKTVTTAWIFNFAEDGFIFLKQNFINRNKRNFWFE